MKAARRRFTPAMPPQGLDPQKLALWTFQQLQLAADTIAELEDRLDADIGSDDEPWDKAAETRTGRVIG